MLTLASCAVISVGIAYDNPKVSPILLQRVSYESSVKTFGGM